MTDVFICNTPDGGEIDIVDGVVTLNGGIESAVYLSLFGGNSDDAGGQDRSLEFWGNIGEQQNEQQRSRTQHLLESIPPSSFNLRRIEDAARADLAWMLDTRAATAIDVAVSIPGPNQIKIVVDVQAVGRFEYVENWRASA